MTAKEYLWQIRQAERRIRVRQAQLDELRTMATGLKSPVMDANKVQTSGFAADKMADNIARIEGLSEAIQADISAWITLVDKITTEINSLSNATYSELLFKRYVESKIFEQIAKEMQYDFDWVRKLHSRALNLFEDEILKQHTETHI